MANNILKEKLMSGKVVVGMSEHTGSPVIAEIMGIAGFDFVYIDTEHTPFGLETVENLVRASDSVGTTPIVRVYENDPHLIMRVLDTGAQGIVVPGIRSSEDARRAVEACRYPPEGSRGVCAGVRAVGYSLDSWGAKTRNANKDTLVQIIIENREAVNNLDEILAVSGVDVISFGSGDYSQDVGLTRNHPDVEAVKQDVMRRALAGGKQVICLLLQDLTSIGNYLSFKQMKRYYDMGVRGFMYTSDVLVWAQLCKDLAEAKKTLASGRSQSTGGY